MMLSHTIGKVTTSLLIATLSFTSACDRSGPPAASAPASNRAADSSKAQDSGPFEVITASGIEMIFVPAGEFSMGSDKNGGDEAPAHRVRLTAYLMDKFEATQGMFARVQLPNPSHWQDNAKKPVERVRWRDAKQYCNERSALEGLKPCYNEKTPDWVGDYDAEGNGFPPDAKGESACRAGKDEPFEFGQPDKLRQYGWFAENGSEKTHVIGEKKPNGWGLYDLYGNVSEWCEDVYNPTYYKESTTADPTGPANPGKDVKRVMRGGSWKSSADMCRSTYREGQRTGDTDACFYTDYCGFRCVRRATLSQLQKMREAKR